MTVDDKTKDEKLLYDINKEAGKTLALSSRKIDKYEYLTGEEILPSNQKQIQVFLINNQKCKQSPRKSLICETISKKFAGATKRRKLNNPQREQYKTTRTV